MAELPRDPDVRDKGTPGGLWRDISPVESFCLKKDGQGFYIRGTRIWWAEVARALDEAHIAAPKEIELELIKGNKYNGYREYVFALKGTEPLMKLHVFRLKKAKRGLEWPECTSAASRYGAKAETAAKSFNKTAFMLKTMQKVRPSLFGLFGEGQNVECLKAGWYLNETDDWKNLRDVSDAEEKKNKIAQVVEALAAGPLAGLHMEEADAAVYTLQMARFLQDPEVLNKMLTKIRKVIGLGHEELLNRLEKSSRELFLNAIYMQFADVLPLQWGYGLVLSPGTPFDFGSCRFKEEGGKSKIIHLRKPNGFYWIPLLEEFIFAIHAFFPTMHHRKCRELRDEYLSILTASGLKLNYNPAKLETVTDLYTPKGVFFALYHKAREIEDMDDGKERRELVTYLEWKIASFCDTAIASRLSLHQIAMVAFK